MSVSVRVTAIKCRFLPHIQAGLYGLRGRGGYEAAMDTRTSPHAALETGRRPTCAPVSLERGVAKHAEGSCLVRFGDTHVLCTASLEEKVPPWLRGAGKGWVTAEYGMLPRATSERTRREASAGKQSGRTLEIQRLIGRSLRAVVDLPALGERQIIVDCDVSRPTAAPAPPRSPAAGWRSATASNGCAARDMIAQAGARRPRRRGLRRHLPRRSRCSTSTMPRTARPRPTPISS